MKKQTNKKTVYAGFIAALGLAAFSAAIISPSIFATSTSGNVRLDTEVATAIAMKIASPNDTNPECMTQSGVTYGEANRYATSNGAEGSKQVDTFDGTTGGADEINTNTSCAMLTMNPNAYDSTYSDVTVYTNSGNGYALTLEATEPNLVNTTDNTQYIPAGTLVESNNTVAGGQNAWSYKTDNGIITSWTPVSSTAATIKSYTGETSGGDTTRVTYGVSSGNNLTGKYATTLTYTATMFDGDNPYVSKITIPTVSNLTANAESLDIPFGHSASVTVTPATGYYLSSVTCPTGFTCSGYVTDKSNAASAAAQTITLVNGNTNNTGTLALSAATQVDPFAACGSSTGSQCTVNGVAYIRLADGHLWTKNSQGSTTWDSTLSSVSCPSGTSKPTAPVFNTLLSNYGGSYNTTDYGSPYGMYVDSGALYNATGWSGAFWSTTEYSSARAWRLDVGSSYALVSNSRQKSRSAKVVCYR